MRSYKNIPYYFVGFSIFILLKLWFSKAANSDLFFLLKPSDFFISLFFGSRSVFIPDVGYYHENLNIIIDKSCCGFNYMLLCFLIFSYLFVNYFNKPLYKAFSLAAALMLSYLMAIFVNISRIGFSIFIYNHIITFSQVNQKNAHLTVGIFTYLFFLTLAWLVTDKLLNKRKLHEKYN